MSEVLCKTLLPIGKVSRCKVVEVEIIAYWEQQKQWQFMEREKSAKFHNSRRGTNISPDMMSIKKTTGWNMTACQKDVTPVIATMHYLSQESLP